MEGNGPSKRPSDDSTQEHRNKRQKKARRKQTGRKSGPSKESTNVGLSCSACRQVSHEFSKGQMKLAKCGEPARCRPCCQADLVGASCQSCQIWRCHFSKLEKRKARKGEPATCESCEEADRKAKKEAALEEKRRRSEREAELSKPQCCVTCGIEKNRDEFSPSQWWPEFDGISIQVAIRSTEPLEELKSKFKAGKCLVCYPKRQEEFDQMRNNYDALWRNEQVCFYEYPYEMDNEWFALSSDIAGEYDVLYHCLRGEADDSLQRTAHGKLTIVRENDEYRGKMEFFNKDDDLVWKRPDFEFFESTTTIDKVEFEMEDLPEEMMTESSRGQIRQLNRRVACRWIPNEHILAHEEDEEDEEDDEDEEDEDNNGFVPRFKDAAEADRYLDSLSPNPRTSWLARLFPSEDGIISLIHDYARAWRPTSPVLFFEPGDLVIDVDWWDDPREASYSSFVARRRTG